MTVFRNRLIFNLSYICIWVGYFVFTRIIFLAYYHNELSDVEYFSIIQIFIHGLKLDFSLSAYLSIIPFLIIVSSVWISNKSTLFVIKAYTLPVLFFVNFLMIVDLLLYEHWGIRLDSTFLNYIDSPKEMIASISYANLFFVITIWFVSSILYSKIFNRFFYLSLSNLRKGKVWEMPLLLLATVPLVIMMRGGLQTIPINQSDVYFSDKIFVNHAAVNFMWNLGHSINQNSYDTRNPFAELDMNRASNIFEDAMEPLIKKDTTDFQILKTSKPNVILIVWESFTAKAVEVLGGEPKITENFNRLSKEGLLFTNFYANGDRTDKGLVSIFSGYYPQPNTSIINIPSKTRNLPMLTEEMSELGYINSFYYGGDLNFGNMKTYLFNKGIEHFIDKNEFDSDYWNSKWGVHDHILFNRVLSDFSKNQPLPFFKIIFTLSSHEPFEFPDAYKFGKDTEENKFRSSLAYTDKAIGLFIENAKSEPWWDNTLIVIMADHGHRSPKRNGILNAPSKFHIPMLWLGGALVQTNKINENICAQTDFAYSLLTLLDGDNEKFKYGKNIFKKSTNHFAHYIFKNGFGIINNEGFVVYDYIGNKSILQKGNSTQIMKELGLAITQISYQNFIER